MAKQSKEVRLQNAINAIRDGGTTVREASRLFEVPRNTIAHRMTGTKPRSEAFECQQRLSAAEENSIVEVSLQMNVWGWPLTISALETFATHFLQAKGDQKPLGQNWYKNFLHRHPELRLQRARNLDQQRKDGANFQSIQHWFDTYNRILLSYDVAIEDTYNMDEKGLMKGVGDNAKVFVPRSAKTATTVQAGNREWVSIIECIGTNGYVLPPFIIFEGERIQQSWLSKGLDQRTVIRMTPNGWTDQSVALEWLRHFDSYTKNNVKGKYRLLILDGHSSHQTIEFVRYCEEAKIIPLCLPPHTTHVLQPLDVGIFSPLAKAYKKQVSQEAVFGAERINNKQFLLIYQEARKTIASNIPGAWRGVGLYPYNPNKILEPYRPQPLDAAAAAAAGGTTTTTTITVTITETTSLSPGSTSSTTRNRVMNEVNKVASDTLAVCPTPLRPSVTFLHQTCVSSLTDNVALEALNEGLVRKQESKRRKKTNMKSFGKAKMLNIKEMEDDMAKRNKEEQERLDEKTRRAILRGKVGFAKLVWKEMPVSFDLFNSD